MEHNAGSTPWTIIGIGADGEHHVYHVNARDEADARRIGREQFGLNVKAVQPMPNTSSPGDLADWEVIGIAKDSGVYVVRHVRAHEQTEARAIATERLGLEVTLPRREALPATGCATICVVVAAINFVAAFLLLEFGEAPAIIAAIAAGTLLIAGVLLVGVGAIERLKETISQRL